MARSLAETAQAIRASLAGPDRARGESESIRLAFSFIKLYEQARVQSVFTCSRTALRPLVTPRFDALLAALAEHLCAEHGSESPAWVGHTSRFLGRWWFVAGMRSLEADAFVHSPISFARRGVFIADGALSYAPDLLLDRHGPPCAFRALDEELERDKTRAGTFSSSGAPRWPWLTTRADLRLTSMRFSFRQPRFELPPAAWPNVSIVTWTGSMTERRLSCPATIRIRATSSRASTCG